MRYSLIAIHKDSLLLLIICEKEEIDGGPSETNYESIFDSNDNALNIIEYIC